MNSKDLFMFDNILHIISNNFFINKTNKKKVLLVFEPIVYI
jgi:hypothetical protein